jgi:hypothetical protein
MAEMLILSATFSNQAEDKLRNEGTGLTRSLGIVNLSLWCRCGAVVVLLSCRCSVVSVLLSLLLLLLLLCLFSSYVLKETYFVNIFSYFF